MSDDADYLKALEVQRRNFELQFGSVEELGYDDKLTRTKRNGRKKSQDSEEEYDLSGDDDEEENEENKENKENEENEEEEEDEYSHSSDDSSLESDFSNSDSEIEIVLHQASSNLASRGNKADNDISTPAPKVVKLNSSTPPPSFSQTNKIERKLLKSGRAATLREIELKERQALEAQKRQNRGTSTKEDSENLENDLKLQRLLQESHILASGDAAQKYSGAELTLQTIDYEDPTGLSRKRLLASRINELTQTNRTKQRKLESMPMNMRKNMIAKRDLKVKQYEKEAKDAGIVLSKLRKGQVRDLKAGRGVTSQADRLGTGLKKNKNNNTKRERGLKIHGVGKATRNGLIISQGDIERINNKGKKQFRKLR